MLISWTHLLLGGGAAVITGLDRTAALQFMICRPLVAGPLTGLMLGDWLVGMQVGMLLELLWLGRLPVGAAIPPDDTQVAVGSTVLAVSLAEIGDSNSLAFVILCVLIAMPLGKAGQFFDHLARARNGRLLTRIEHTLDSQEGCSEYCHLLGLFNFGVASLATYMLIVGCGTPLLRYLGPLLLPSLTPAADWVKILFPIIGTAAILGMVNVNRSITLFSAAYAMALLLLWLA
ncbi:MAG: PTS sugar transporter subunit IIC [Desulfuromonadaceae bacterium]|nr:PTS sugar transporter subunit IIC [Desulfuromonadaceae bacterium]